MTILKSFNDRIDAMREAERVGAARVDDAVREWIQKFSHDAFDETPHDPSDFHVWGTALSFVDRDFAAHFRRPMTRDERHCRNLVVAADFVRLQQVGVAEDRTVKSTRRDQWR